MQLFYQPELVNGIHHLDADESRHAIKVLRLKNRSRDQLDRWRWGLSIRRPLQMRTTESVNLKSQKREKKLKEQATDTLPIAPNQKP